MHPPAVGAELQTFLALDFGTRRTGVAYGSRLLGQARPLATIQARETQRRLDLIQAPIDEWQPQALVVGVPLHPDGAEHANTLLARKFARSLRNRSSCRCSRWTSATARPKHYRTVHATPMPALPASFLNNSCGACHDVIATDER